MRFLLATVFLSLSTPAVADPVCAVVESLASMAMGLRQLGRSEADARAEFAGTNFRGQTALALVADFLVTEAYQKPQAAPERRLDALRDFSRHLHERCLRLVQ